jgi:pilus assembly protein Flp/PilA
MNAFVDLPIRLAVWLQTLGLELEHTRRRAERGQGMVEYGIILALIAVAAIAVLILLGPQVKDMFQDALDLVQTRPGAPS